MWHKRPWTHVSSLSQPCLIYFLQLPCSRLISPLPSGLWCEDLSIAGARMDLPGIRDKNFKFYACNIYMWAFYPEHCHIDLNFSCSEIGHAPPHFRSHHQNWAGFMSPGNDLQLWRASCHPGNNLQLGQTCHPDNDIEPGHVLWRPDNFWQTRTCFMTPWQWQWKTTCFFTLWKT